MLDHLETRPGLLGFPPARNQVGSKFWIKYEQVATAMEILHATGQGISHQHLCFGRDARTAEAGDVS